MLFSGPDNSPKLSLPVGDLDPIYYMVPWAIRVSPQTASRSVWPFLQGTSVGQTDRVICDTCIAMHAIRPKYPFYIARRDVMRYHETVVRRRMRRRTYRKIHNTTECTE